MAEVHAIREGLIPGPQPADENVVAVLAELLEQARSGEIRGLVVGVLVPGDLTTFRRAGRQTRSLVGVLEIAKADMIAAHLENS